jgi:hypothetical protein
MAKKPVLGHRRTVDVDERNDAADGDDDPNKPRTVTA